MALAYHSNTESTHNQKKLARNPAQPRIHSHSHTPGLEFDFVVAERIRYIPNSGPPLQPVELMPVHDKDGIIEDVINIAGSAKYIISYKHKPALRMCVKPEHVRNYVSARTLEAWEWKHTSSSDQLSNSILGVTEKNVQGSHENYNSKESAHSATQVLHVGGQSSSMEVSVPSVAWGGGMGLGMRPKSPLDVQNYASLYVSPKRPSPLTASKQRGLAEAVISEVESSDEDEDEVVDEDEHTSVALDRQLNRNLTEDALNSKLPKQTSPSLITGDDSPMLQEDFSEVLKRDRAESSSSTKITNNTPLFSAHGPKRRKTSHSKPSVVSIPSREPSHSHQWFDLDDATMRELNNSIPQPQKKSPSQQKRAKPKTPTRLTKAQSNKLKFEAMHGMEEDESSPDALQGTPFSGRQQPYYPAPASPRSDGQSRRVPSAHRELTPVLSRSQRSLSLKQATPEKDRSHFSLQQTSPGYANTHVLALAELELDGEESDHAYEVEAILRAKRRIVNGERKLHYLIKWVGGYPNTWEPAQNVGPGSIADWKREKLRRKQAAKINADSISEHDEVVNDDSRAFLPKNPVPHMYSNITGFDEEVGD